MNIVDALHGLADLAAEEPLLLLALLLAVGGLVGSLKIGSFSLGPAAVLFTALAFSAFDERLKIAREVGIFGLAVFAFVIGIGAGPSFFSALKTGGRVLGAIVSVLLLGGVITVLVGHGLGLSGPLLSGVYAGALTNTPALAAANQMWESELPTVGYSVTYLFGVLGMLLAALIALKLRKPEIDTDDVLTNAPALESLTIRIEKPHLGTCGSIAESYEHKIRFSRIMRGDAPGHPGRVFIATDEDELEAGDIVNVIGDAEHVAHFASAAGHPSTVGLTLDRTTLDYRRITISNAEVVGKTIEDLRLTRRFGAVATRVRRGDIDLLATDDLVLAQGDRIRVVAPREKLPLIAAFFGDSEKQAQSFSLTSLALGLALGVLLGLIEFPLPGGGVFALGMAGGPLIVGLLLGRVGRTGSWIWTLPASASTTLNHLGMMLFLAYAGSSSGAALAEAIVTPTGWRLFVVGVCVTITVAIGQLTITRLFAGAHGPKLAGIMAGAQTQPAVLAYANVRTNDDARVNLGYALAYPIGMIAKVLIAPLLGRF